MIKAAKFLSVIILFISLTTYKPNIKNKSNSLIFPLQKILIENNEILTNKELISELEYLSGNNLLFINNKTIRQEIDKFNFISGFKIKKIYPNTMKIIIYEKKIVAVFIENNKKFFLSKKGEILPFKKIKFYNDLPTVYEKKGDFMNLFKNLEKTDFPINKIKSFYYFEIGRWDILFKNNKLLKLPSKKYIDSLKNYILLSENKNFDKYKIFDYRLKKQLILN